MAEFRCSKRVARVCQHQLSFLFLHSRLSNQAKLGKTMSAQVKTAMLQQEACQWLWWSISVYTSVGMSDPFGSSLRREGCGDFKFSGNYPHCTWNWQNHFWNLLRSFHVVCFHRSGTNCLLYAIDRGFGHFGQLFKAHLLNWSGTYWLLLLALVTKSYLFTYLLIYLLNEKVTVTPY